MACYPGDINGDSSIRRSDPEMIGMQKTTVATYNNRLYNRAEMFMESEVMSMDRTDQQLRELIRIVVRNLGMLEKTVPCCGITLAQCQAIVEIGREKVISLTDLADLVGLDKSTMSRTINNLVRAGFVHREQDENNRRYVAIRLTDRGSTLYRDIENSMTDYYQRLLGSIQKEKQAQVNESLTLLLKSARRTECCPKSRLSAV